MTAKKNNGTPEKPATKPEQAKKTEPFSVDLSSFIVGNGELGDAVKTRKRNKQQEFFDDLVMDAYEKWEKAGKPRLTIKKPNKYIQVPDEEDVIKYAQSMLRKSALFCKIGLKLGDLQPGELPQTVRIYFTCQDLQKKTRTTDPGAPDVQENQADSSLPE